MQAVLNPLAAAAASGSQQQQFEVHANELVFGADGLSSGDLQRQIQHGRDKVKVLEQLMQQHKSGSSSSGAVVYVGDSASDILPLLKVGAKGCCWFLFNPKSSCCYVQTFAAAAVCCSGWCVFD